MSGDNRLNSAAQAAGAAASIREDSLTSDDFVE
jgi:hypothetical protein